MGDSYGKNLESSVMNDPCWIRFFEGRFLFREANLSGKPLDPPFNESQRSLLVQRYMQGYSCKEVAAQRGIAPGSVRVELNRARKAFKVGYERLQKENEASG